MSSPLPIGSPMERGASESSLMLQPLMPAGPTVETLEFLRTIKLTNVVATTNLDCKPDLKNLAMGARNAEYSPRRFPAVIMHIKEPKSAALIFSSGKMVVTGTKSEQESQIAARKYTTIVRKLNNGQGSFTEFKLQNMTASADAKFPIRLESLVMDHTRYCSYEPELFPGLVYRMYNPKVVLLIFVSGRLIVTGAKSRADIETALEKIHPILLQYRKVPMLSASASGQSAVLAGAMAGGASR